MSPIPRVQIAFQGGGAKLVSMLPVAHAFKKCHDDGIIDISAVSGASAGSICAGLIASHSDFPEVLSFLRRDGDDYINRIVSNEAKYFSEFLRDSNWNKIKYITTNAPFLYGVLIKGNPILDEKSFVQFVKKIFSSGKYRKIEDCKIGLHINASNIVEQANKTFQNGSIYSAVVDSASIPFAFRSFRSMSKTHVVDGGLCQNLPTDVLVQNGNDPIFAVFPDHHEEGNEVTNILQYCFSLFSASISHNVQRSRQQVSKAFSIAAPCEYGTFDFKAALAQIKDENWYNSAFEEYRAQIRDFATNYGYLHSKKQFRYADIDSRDDYAQALSLLTEDYHQYIEYKVGRFHVIVNCDRYLSTEDDEGHRPADTIVKTATLKVVKEGFGYFRSFLGLDPQTNLPRPTVWTARNLTKGIDLDIAVLSLKGEAKGSNAGRNCVVIFNKSDEQISVGDEIEIIDSSYSRNGMIEMNRRRSDFISLENSHPLDTKKVELVITYPKKLGTYKMTNRSGYSTVNDGNVREMIFSDEEKRSLPPEFDILGLTTDNLPPGHKFSGIAYRV